MASAQLQEYFTISLEEPSYFNHDFYHHFYFLTH
jgi:hypothetical protein